VTPTKDDILPPARVASSSTSDGVGRPGVKKMRAKSLFGEGGEGRGEGGEDDVEMAESPKKKSRP